MIEETENRKEKFTKFYNKYYKHLLIMPAALLLISLIYLGIFISQTGDIVYKDVSLTGGTTITIFDQMISSDDVSAGLKEQFPDIIVRAISNFRTGTQQAIIVESIASPEELKPALEQFLGYEITSENSSVEFTGAALSKGFYQQLRLAILVSFVLMAIVVFIIFKTPIPSLAVILAAFADIVFTIVVINLFGISLSIAGIVALLMLIGYSVDTDIMLTSKVIKQKQDPLNTRLYKALKTGLTMTLTSIAAIAVVLIVIFNFSDTLRQIFSILLIGLGFDLFNTWITNASILKWYAEKKGMY